MSAEHDILNCEMEELAYGWLYHGNILRGLRECYHGLHYQDSCPRCTSRVARMRIVARMEQIDMAFAEMAS